MRTNTIIRFVLFMMVAAAAASTAFFLFPQVKAVQAEVPAAIAFASSIMQLGAAACFLLTLSTIKAGYKSAYALFALGIGLFSILQILPSSTVFSDFIANHLTLYQVTFVASYASGTLCMYLGMRRFARLLGAKTIWASFLLALGMATAVAVAGGICVHFSNITSLIASFSKLDFMSYVSIT